MPFFQDGCHSLANCLIFENMGVTDAFSMVSNPIQSPIYFYSEVIFIKLAIPSKGKGGRVGGGGGGV